MILALRKLKRELETGGKRTEESSGTSTESRECATVCVFKFSFLNSATQASAKGCAVVKEAITSDSVE